MKPQAGIWYREHQMLAVPQMTILARGTVLRISSDFYPIQLLTNGNFEMIQIYSN
jgi:hypothetical protein